MKIITATASCGSRWLRLRASAPEIQKAAENAAARKVLESLNYVGVLAIEFFECDGQLLANEMAPRVHNSGHWTIEGAVTSQFENHLRAINGFPLGSTTAIGASAMINLIGEVPETAKVSGYSVRSSSSLRQRSPPRPQIGPCDAPGSVFRPTHEPFFQLTCLFPAPRLLFGSGESRKHLSAELNRLPSLGGQGPGCRTPLRMLRFGIP